MTNEAKERLELRTTILDLIDRRRKETGDASLGSSIERHLIDEELKDLETLSPVDAEPVMVPVRLRGRGRQSSRPL